MTEDSDQPGPRNLGALARILGAFAAPPALVVALAYYFAVKRQQTLAEHFGIDTSVLGYSTQDYLLRGGDTLFLVLLFAALTGLAAIAAHVALTRHAQATWPPGRLQATSTALKVTGAALLVLGVVAVFEALPVHDLVRSLSSGVGIVLLVYGFYFAGRLRGHGFFNRAGRRDFDPLFVASIALVGVVVFLSAFWATKDLAEGLGRGQARRLERTVTQRPGAIVYSERRLQLGVPELALSGGGYGYRYTGLRLLVRSDGRYLLIPEGWSRMSGVVVVLREDDSLRVEFTPGRRR